ncbi:hypothetical protein [Oryza sativa Japonica Group]|uniref:Uncharacterized protein P0034C09.24 n=1 Tax=Oryza sativa subsp. japonica TaxID=39947 RepID=Q5N7S0_ORYSJ|nr:hypothetical protein [Oryza sativa Japonica Group]
MELELLLRRDHYSAFICSLPTPPLLSAPPPLPRQCPNPQPLVLAARQFPSPLSASPALAGGYRRHLPPQAHATAPSFANRHCRSGRAGEGREI